jgi:predicted nucleic acid-binding protein
MASREVFLDTSGLYALIDRKDAHHRPARQAATRFASQGRRLIVTDYVVDEAVTLAKVRGGVRVALRILDLVEQSAGIRIEWIDAARFAAAAAFFRTHDDHAYSFTDCASFIVMRDLRLRQVLTTDRHFLQAGFDALLAAR